MDDNPPLAMENSLSVMDGNWDANRFNSAVLSETVFMVHICGYENQDNAGNEMGNPSINHWAVFLQHDDMASVRLDMIPGFGSDCLRGKLYVSSRSYASTYKAFKTVSFPTVGAPTVQAIINLIGEKGRSKYDFTEDCEGCRYWTFTIISDLEGEGFLPAGSRQVALEALSQFQTGSGSEPRTIAQGTFR